MDVLIPFKCTGRVLAQFIFVFLSVFATNIAPVWASENRMALVIGNANYTSLAPLRNPVADAEAVGQSLSALGFRVYLGTNLTQETQSEAIAFFGEKSQEADTALVYFAGHGAYIDGESFLFPIDFDHNANFDPLHATSLASLQSIMTHDLRRNIFILDTCQDDPFLQKDDEYPNLMANNTHPNLSSLEALLVLSSSPGSVAYDGSGKHSLFAGAFLDNMAAPDLDIELMLRDVRRDVLRNSEGAQLPQTYSSMVSSFTLAPTTSGREQSPSFVQKNRTATLSETGFSSKPLLGQIAKGLSPQTPLYLEETAKMRLRQHLCNSLSTPLPAACMRVPATKVLAH